MLLCAASASSWNCAGQLGEMLIALSQMEWSEDSDRLNKQLHIRGRRAPARFGCRCSGRYWHGMMLTCGMEGREC